MEISSRARGVAGLIALLALAALGAVALWGVTPPRPRPADISEDDFSAARAYAHVERIGSRVHVAGSPAGDQVRSYLETTLRDLGLTTEVQDAVGMTDALGGFGMARVRNVVAVLPGTAPTGRVFLVAHYDSVQVSYGGNDDGAGTATILETARILARGERPRNDIVFVLTDAEEACLCGAEAFVSQHRLAADGGVVLNLEARGSSGPAIMFETSTGNANLVGVYGSAAPYPVGTSFAVEVYRILPNDTDFTPFLDAPQRFGGLNAAYIDGSGVYHTPQDTPSSMDKASLQHHGDNAVALARAFGAAELGPLTEPAAFDSTYFPFARLVLVRYPGWLVWPLAGLALLAVVALAVMARRRGLVSWPRVAAGFGLGLVPLLVAPVLAQLLWTALVARRPGYVEMIDPWRPGWFRVGVVALVATVVLTWYGLLRRRIGAWPLTIGALAWFAVLGLVLAAATPGGSYLAALPALGGAIGGAGALVARPVWGRVGALGVGAAVAVIILAPTVQLFFPALGLATGGAPAFFATLLGLALLPVLEWCYPTEAGRRLRSAAPAALAAVVAVACVATGLSVDRFDAEHPEPAQLMYVLDTDTGRAHWVSAEADPGEWTRRYVTGREDLSGPFPLLGYEPLAAGPAEAATLPAPGLGVTSDATSGNRRTVTLQIVPQRPVRLVALGVERGVRVLEATVAGRPLPPDAVGEGLGILFHAPPDDGIAITLVLDRPGPVKLRVTDGSDGLNGLPGFEPRPAGVGVEGSHDSELVLVARTYVV